MKTMTPDNKIKKTGLGAKASRRLGNTVIYIILIAITVIWLFPFFGIVLESFRTEYAGQVSYLWPKELGLDNYIRLFKETDFFRWFKNTGIMGVATAVIQTFFVLSMSYVLSRLRFKARKPLMNFMLILGMFPGFLTMILIYKVFSDFGLTMQNAPLGLIIVYCASSGMGYYVSKGFFDTIPRSLDEAARVDGATRWQVFYKLTLPLSKPIIATLSLFYAVGRWNSYSDNIYYIKTDALKMVQYKLYQMVSSAQEAQTAQLSEAVAVTSTPEVLQAAMIMFVTIPVICIYPFLQKYFVKGIMVGAVKG